MHTSLDFRYLVEQSKTNTDNFIDHKWQSTQECPVWCLRNQKNLLRLHPRRLWHLHAHKQQRHQNQSSYTSRACQNSESACRARARQESSGLNKRMEIEPSVRTLRFILDSKLCVIFHVCISVQRLQSRYFYYSA